MILTQEKTRQLEEAAKPLVKFLCENCNPHTYIIVEPGGAELVEGVSRVKIEEFIKD